MNRFQLITAGAGEFGVQAKYLDREVDFVDHALAGWLHFCPKLQVLRRVVKSISVLVMNVFVFHERPPERFGHKVTVLEYFFASSEMQAPVTGRVDISFGVNWTPAAAFVTAFSRTKALLHNVAGVFAVLSSAKIPLGGFATPFTLKSRNWFFVHDASLAQPFRLSSR
jgi:hypothetical protein